MNMQVPQGKKAFSRKNLKPGRHCFTSCFNISIFFLNVDFFSDTWYNGLNR